MSDDAFQITKEQVYARDESASKLFGYTWSEMTLLAVSLFGSNLLFDNRYVTLACVGGAYLYIKKLKTSMPERFLHNFLRYQLRVMRRAVFYRASARDIEWQPPIVP